MHTSRYQYRDGLGFAKSGQVLEITIRTVGIFNIPVTDPLWCRRDNGDGTLAHHPYELSAAATEFSGSNHGGAIPGPSAR
jgi:hypothetical protein